MADPISTSIDAAAQAWAEAVGAWVNAVNAMCDGWKGVTPVDSGHTGFNEQTVTLPSQPAYTDLHPGSFTDLNNNQLANGTVTLTPTKMAGGAAVPVTVTVIPAQGTASGTYSGAILDATTGKSLLEPVMVYVVGDCPPGPLT